MLIILILVFNYVRVCKSFKTYVGEYLDPVYMLCLYCVNAFQFPFYIYYIYTVKLVKFV